ncbi:hypothetical protein [Mesorhizobium sp. M0296]|uniref:hypothetical protein n=1 Tax=Mesorhizobium sp. M0296 TaxID=2956931 RepID=UPI00333D977C
MIAGLLAAVSGRALWIAMAVLAGFALVGGVFLYGRSVEAQAGRVSALEDTVKAYRKRNDVDATVRNMDAADLCAELGGLPDDCKQLRGVE